MRYAAPALTSALLIATAACAPRDVSTRSPVLPNMIPAGQLVLIDYAEGPRAEWIGGQGLGSFSERMDARGARFGPFRVIAHMPGALVYDVGDGSCTIALSGIASCTDGSRGVWRAAPG